MKTSAVYKITNTITGDFYIGSSKNVKARWAAHKCHSTWKNHQNNPMYLDMQKYGVDKFEFQILEEVEPEQLKEKEQQFIEKLQPTYNSMYAKGKNVERDKESHRKYNQSEKGKESQRKRSRKYHSQLCFYNGKTLTFGALAIRFQRAGIKHPNLEAKKYLLDI